MKYVGTYSDPKDIVTKEKLEAVASRVSTNEDNIAMAESDIDGLQTTVGTLQTNVGNIQTALTSKQDTVVGGASTITEDNLTASRALVSNSSGKVTVSTITSTELGYLDGVTSNVQTQLNKKIEKAPVTSVNNKTGAVTLGKSDVGLGNVDNVKQYSATNPPPYPVTSVNGATGEVKSTFYVTVTQGNGNSATADKTAEEVYAAHAAGYAVYAIAKFPELSPLPFMLPLVVAMSIGGTLRLGFAVIGSLNPSDVPMYPTVAYSGASKKWLAWIGALARASDIPEGVPAVTTADNGKFLRVVNGAWAAVEIANANGGSF